MTSILLQKASVNFIFKILTKLLSIYGSVGRWGNLILLALLIVFGLVSRMFAAVKYLYADYILEIFLAVFAAVLVWRISGKNFLPSVNPKIFKKLLIAGIVLRILFAVHDFYNRPVQDSDYEKHEKLGQRLAAEGEFYDFTGVELRNFRQPGLPVVFAAGLLIYNNPVTYGVVMIIFSFGVLISAYYLFNGFKNIASVLSFVYIAIAPNMLFMASNSNTQLPFFFFVILLFIALKNYSGKFYQMVIIAALLAAEMYVRFNFMMILIMIPFLIERHRDENIFYGVRKAGIVLGLFMIFYSPWIYRNYLLYGSIRLMPTTGLGLYSSNVTSDYTKAGGYNGVPDSVLNKYKNLSEVEFDKRLNNDAMNFIKDHPADYIKGIPFRLMKYGGRQDWTIDYFFEHTNYSDSKLLDTIFQSIENFLFWIILFFPFVYLFRSKRLGALSTYVLWAYLSYSMALLPISETRSRYNFPYLLFPIFAASFVRQDITTSRSKA